MCAARGDRTVYRRSQMGGESDRQDEYKPEDVVYSKVQ